MPESQLDGITSDLVIADAVDYIGICLGSITVSDRGVLRMRGVCVSPSACSAEALCICSGSQAQALQTKAAF